MQKNFDSGGVRIQKKTVLWVSLAVSILVVIDEILKAMALNRLPQEGELSALAPITLAVHKNFGVAFDLPFSLPLVLVVTLLLGAFLFHIAITNRKKHPAITLGAVLIIIGGLGNLYDRLVYGFTVDYFIILGRLALNLSDLVILSGVVVFLVASQRRTHKLVHSNEPE